jgi:hypothetical protein
MDYGVTDLIWLPGAELKMPPSKANASVIGTTAKDGCTFPINSFKSCYKKAGKVFLEPGTLCVEHQ